MLIMEFICKIPSQTPWCPSLGKGWQVAGLWWPAACTLYTSTAPSGWWQNHILPPEEQKCHKVSELENTSPIRVAVGHVSIEENYWMWMRCNLRSMAILSSRKRWGSILSITSGEGTRGHYTISWRCF